MIADTTDGPKVSAPGARLAPDPDSLITRHLPMAGRLAAQYRGRRLELDELVATANLALVEAAHRYDLAEFPEESFARYAERVIRSHLREALFRAPIVRQSRSRERAALRRGDAAPGWALHGVPVESMGLMARDRDDRDEVLELALAQCTDLERELVALMYAGGLTVLQAGRRMGLGRTEARQAYRGAMAALEAGFRARGFEVPMAAPN